MSEGKPFIVNALWQEKLEKIAQETPPCTMDYRKVFAGTSSSTLNVKSLMEKMGIERGAESEEDEITPDELLENVSQLLSVASEHTNVIAMTHNPPTSKWRRKLKTTFLKVVCWPSRRYLYAQIKYNEEILAANYEALRLSLELYKRIRSSQEVIEELTEECYEALRQSEVSKYKVESMEKTVSALSRKKTGNPGSEDKKA